MCSSAKDTCQAPGDGVGVSLHRSACAPLGLCKCAGAPIKLKRGVSQRRFSWWRTGKGSGASLTQRVSRVHVCLQTRAPQGTSATPLGCSLQRALGVGGRPCGRHGAGGGVGEIRELTGREGGPAERQEGEFPHPACQVGSPLASFETDHISGTAPPELLRVATGLGSETA